MPAALVFVRHLACVSIALTVTAAACGNSGNAQGTQGKGGQGDGGFFDRDGNGVVLPDGAIASSSGGGGTASGSSGSGSNGSSGAGGGNGGCPAYQAMCAGQCIPVSIDPKNCGGCGVACNGSQVCSGGACSAGCLPGTSACNGSCVDLQSDNNHCGDCSTVCPGGQGCSAGACVPAIGKSSLPQCAGAGPAVVLGTMPAGCIAQVTFSWTLCSCKDVVCSDVLMTDAYDSQKGPYKPGGLGGGVGVDERVNVSSLLDVGGTLWASSPNGTSPSSSTTVRQDMHIGGPVSTSAMMTVSGDAYVAGNVSGNVQIGKTLYLPSGDTASGGVTYKALVNQSVSVPPPCDCTPQGLLPIASWIAAARPPNNDNASIGLSPTALQNPAGDIHLDLPCGRYYLKGISSGNSVTIAAHGNTALFIDGNVSADSGISFVLDPTAQFDVVIGGTINASSGLVVGSPNYPALSRTYIGSMNTVDLSASGQIGGNVYAGYALVSLSSDYEQYGSLFAGNFNATGSARIHYDLATVTGGLCPPPPMTTPDAGGGSSSGGGGGNSSGSSGGGSPPTCGTCKDCGNQACINGTCGSCSSNSQCCPPLVCVSPGFCEPLAL